MAGLTKLAKASKSALENFLGLLEEERLLVICDNNMREIGMALFDEGRKLSYDAMYLEMTPLEYDNEEPPESVADMMQKFDAVICPTTRPLHKTYARREASKLGVRVASFSGISAGSFERSMLGDHKKIKALTEALIKKLKDVYTIRVITEAGTDITMPVKRRRVWVNTGILRTIGESGLLPGGEIKMAPLETKSNGEIVINASMGEFGILKNPIKLTVKRGYADRISGKTESKDLSKLLSTAGRNARALGVVGFGLNDKSRISGSIMEDRTVLGTVHFGLGKNLKYGGKVDVQSYIEGVATKPTVYFDDDIIFEDGRVIIDY